MNDTTTPVAAPEVQASELWTRIEQAISKSTGGSVEECATNAVIAVLREDGWIKDGVPPVVQVLADARQFSDELVLTKLVARFFRVMILGGLIIPETPQAMDWLRDYIDGVHSVHGPLGKPMLWPGRLPAVCDLLRGWGFQPTPTNPQFVSLRPGGAMAPIAMPDPQAPDRASVQPLADFMAQLMGTLLDAHTGGLTVGAVDRGTALRAMAAAFAAGQEAGPTETDPVIIAALRQLRDHQRQADEGGERVTVSRQALDEVLAYMAIDRGIG